MVDEITASPQKLLEMEMGDAHLTGASKRHGGWCVGTGRRQLTLGGPHVKVSVDSIRQDSREIKEGLAESYGDHLL